MLHSVTCGKSFERNLTDEGSIAMKEVKEYVQGIQSVFNQERKHEIDQLKYMIYSQGKKIANLEEEDRVHQKMISKLETRVASLEEVNKEQMETNGGDVLNEGNRNVGHGKFSSPTLRLRDHYYFLFVHISSPTSILH